MNQIFTGQWSAGYEPEAEDFSDWRDVLKEIVRLCDKYDQLEK